MNDKLDWSMLDGFFILVIKIKIKQRLTSQLCEKEMISNILSLQEKTNMF
jgi:hypothetical protein